MSVSIISNLPLRPCSRGQERGGCLFTCRWRPGVAVALLRCSRAIRPGSKCGGCWRRILFWSDCYLSTLPQLHPLCTSPPSTCRDTSGRYQALRRLLFHDGAFPFLSVLFLSDLWPSFSCLFISVLSGSFSCSASLSCRIKQVNNKLFFISLLDIFISSFSEAVFSAALSSSPLLCWPCSYKPSEWSREAMEQNHSERGSLMWPLWGSPAVGLVFNQAPGFNSQHARAPLTPAICGGCGGSQNPHALL